MSMLMLEQGGGAKRRNDALLLKVSKEWMTSSWTDIHELPSSLHCTTTTVHVLTVKLYNKCKTHLQIKTYLTFYCYTVNTIRYDFYSMIAHRLIFPPKTSDDFATLGFTLP